jgi:hypothetical protein
MTSDSDAVADDLPDEVEMTPASSTFVVVTPQREEVVRGVVSMEVLKHGEVLFADGYGATLAIFARGNWWHARAVTEEADPA